MIPKTFKPFVQDLLAATDDGKLEWTEGNFGAYFCAKDDLTVHIARQTDEARARDSIRLSFTAAGRMTPFSVAEGTPDFGAMEALYAAVVASANHVDTDLKRFFS